MQIDWFTYGAQIVNFLILLYLLKRFLYDRILEMADERQEEIAERFQTAEEKEKEAAEEAAQYRRQRQELEEKREEWLAEAKENATKKEKEMRQAARQEIDAEKSRWRQALVREQETFLRQLNRQMGRHVYEAARRVLADLADADLERQAVLVFVDRVTGMPADKRREMVDALSTEEETTLTVQSAFPLDEEMEAKIREAVQETFDRETALHFRQDEELICGLALRANGRQVAWNVDSYLDRLRRQIEEALQEEAQETAVAMAEAEETEASRSGMEIPREAEAHA
jgi:F-type H+-transporting ATPase subunit b